MILGQQISKELQDALGLPKHTVGFTLRAYANEMVTVECEYCPNGSFQSALARYHLVPRDDARAAETFNYDAWRADRTERAHREFMERTSRRLPCDWTTDEIRRYFGCKQY